MPKIWIWIIKRLGKFIWNLIMKRKEMKNIREYVEDDNEVDIKVRKLRRDMDKVKRILRKKKLLK